MQLILALRDASSFLMAGFAFSLDCQGAAKAGMSLQSTVKQEPQADVGQPGQSPHGSGQGQLSSSMAVARVISNSMTVRHVCSDEAGPSPSSEFEPLDQHQVLDEK